MNCAHCSSTIASDQRIDSIYCGKKCRQSAWRLARRNADPRATRSSAPAPDDASRSQGDASGAAADDGSANDVSRTTSGSVACPWCGEPVPEGHRRDSRYCGRRCRQSGFRLRQRRVGTEERSTSTPLRIAYADPPYPGLAKRYYQHEDTFAGEVDHIELLERLRGYDAWALSTSARALRVLLPMCPPDARVCAWTKPGRLPWAHTGLHNRWEPLIVVPARAIPPGVADCLHAQPARLGGTLMGRKPIAFAAWLFDVLGAVPGVDVVEDLYPGTGIIGRAWADLSSRAR